MKKLKRFLVLFLIVSVLFCGTGCTGRGGESILEVYFFSAGKADAILFTTEDTWILMDTGERGFGNTILNHLSDRGITQIDCLILTHFDKDHVGGAAKVLHGIPVLQVLQNDFPRESEETERYFAALSDAGLTPVTVTEQYSFSTSGITFTVQPAEREYPSSESNNRSLIVTVECGDVRMLFLGDAENDRLSDFVSASPGHFAFIKMPHHGLWCKRLKDLLSETMPASVVITAPEGTEGTEKTTAYLSEELGTIGRTFNPETGTGFWKL